MSFKAGSIYAEATLDSKKWDSGVKKVQSSFSSMETGAKKVTPALEKVGTATEKASNLFQKSSKKSQSTANKLTQRISSRFPKMANVVEKSFSGIKKGSEFAFKAAAKSAKIASRAFRGVVKVSKSVVQGAKRVGGGFKKVLSGVKNVAGSIAKMAARAFMAVAAGVGVAIKKANDFQKELGNVSSIAKSSGFDIQGLSKQVLNLSPELGSATEITQGLYQSISAGASTAEEAMALTVQSAKFARAGLTDTSTAVDVLSTSINAYGKENMSAEKASDLFFNTIKYGKITGEELGQSIGQSIPLFASSGIELTELTAGMAAMTKQGVKASEATTQMNAIVTAFLKPSEALTKVLKDQGHESGAMLLKTEGLSGALQLLEKASDGNNEKMAEFVPNIRALRGAMALTGEGAKEFNQILLAQKDATGATDEAFKEQEITFATFKNSLSNLSIVVGNIGKHFADKLAVGATKASEGVKEFLLSSEGMNSMGTAAGFVAGAFNVIKKIFGVLKDELMGPIKEVFKTAKSNFEDMSGASLSAGGSMELLAKLTMGVVKAFAWAIEFTAKLAKGLAKTIKIMRLSIELGKALADKRFGRISDEEAEKKIAEAQLALDEGAAEFKNSWGDFGNKLKNIGKDIFGGIAEESADLALVFSDAFADGMENGTNAAKKNWNKLTTGVADTGAKIEDENSKIVDNEEKKIKTMSDILDEWRWKELGETKNQIDKIRNLKNDADNSELESEEEKYKRRVKIWQKYQNFITSGAQSLMSSLSDINNSETQLELQNLELRTQEERRLTEERYQQGILSQEEYNKKVAEIEKQKRAEENKIKLKAFKDNKAFRISETIMAGASAILGWWTSASFLGFPLGIIFAGLMTAATVALTAAKLSIISREKFVPSMATGGIASGLTRVNEEGGEILRLPDRTLVLPHDISENLARNSGKSYNVTVNFSGANINSSLDLNRIVEKVSQRLGKELREAS